MLHDWMRHKHEIGDDTRHQNHAQFEVVMVVHARTKVTLRSETSVPPLVRSPARAPVLPSRTLSHFHLDQNIATTKPRRPTNYIHFASTLYTCD